VHPASALIGRLQIMATESAEFGWDVVVDLVPNLLMPPV
jgi:hypothetical protein